MKGVHVRGVHVRVKGVHVRVKGVHVCEVCMYAGAHLHHLLIHPLREVMQPRHLRRYLYVYV